MLTMGEAATLLGVAKARVSQLASAGRLETTVAAGRRMIVATSLDRYGDGPRGRAAKKTSYTLKAADYEVAR